MISNNFLKIIPATISFFEPHMKTEAFTLLPEELFSYPTPTFFSGSGGVQTLGNVPPRRLDSQQGEGHLAAGTVPVVRRPCALWAALCLAACALLGEHTAVIFTRLWILVWL